MDVTHIFGIELPEFMGKVVILAVAVIAAATVTRIVSRMLRHALDSSSVPNASIFVNIARVLIWAFALLAVMQPVFGITPTAFVTALGVTSLVISLGLQDTISNIIGGLGLMLGKVVQPGDMVEISGFSGEVVDVNWRSTTVRDRVGNEQVIPNSVLNKTALTRLTPASAALCTLDIVVAHGADLDKVAAKIEKIALEALDINLVEGKVSVHFAGSDCYGVQCKVNLFVGTSMAPSVARDTLMRKLAGADWLAREA